MSRRQHEVMALHWILQAVSGDHDSVIIRLVYCVTGPRTSVPHNGTENKLTQTLLLSDMPKITPSVVNKHCNPSSFIVTSVYSFCLL